MTGTIRAVEAPARRPAAGPAAGPGPRLAERHDRRATGGLAGGPRGGRDGEAAAALSAGERRILDDKLRIPMSSFPVLQRQRVIDLLGRAVSRRVTLVSAPAGAGKTVACASWAQRARQRVVWLTLDAEDRQEQFWAYVCAGLDRARPAAPDVLRTLDGCSPGDFPLRLAEAAQLFTEPLVLVLDDVQDVTDPRVLSGLDALIRHAPPALRLVLLARRPPALQLARLRVSGELADITGADLACAPEEAQEYFDMLGIGVGAEQREEVLRRTEGWMAGLRLAALRAHRAAGGVGDSRGVACLAGDEPIVTEYLWDEVLATQTPATRVFLQRTSIVPEVSGDLADALTGEHGGGRTLERLSRENSFVESLGSARDGYRYHPLLRDALIAELRRSAPHEVPALHRRAAHWYAAQGRALEAARSAAHGQDWNFAAETLGKAGLGPALAARPEQVESVLALFPAHRAAHDAAVAAAWAAARLWANDLEGAAAHLDNAARALARPGGAGQRATEPTVAALRVLLAVAQESVDPGVLADGTALAERLASPAGSQAGRRALGTLWLALGLGALSRWEVGPARDALARADRQLGEGGMPELQGRARAWRALAEACCGDLTRAQRAADDVRTGAVPASADMSCPATLAYVQISLARDELPQAERLLGEVEACPAQGMPGEPPARAIAALLRARSRLADGDTVAARGALSCLRGATAAMRAPLAQAVTVTEAEAALRAGESGRARALLLLADDGADPARADVELARASLLLVDGAFHEALAAAQPWLAPGQPPPRRPRTAGGPAAATSHERVRAMLAAAVAHRRLGAVDLAAELLERALDLAEPEGACRVFLDGGAAVRSAMTVLVPPTSRHASFAGRVLERFDAAGPRLAPPRRPEVRLTGSERAVLSFLPSHMTNEEISQALFLSVNTVKTHLRSIYRKLGVGSRREAIARARRLGLL